MILIVTGGIGSGKSEVCRILRDSFGYRIYEADRKAKELYCRFPDLIERIEKALDCRIRTEYGEFAPSLLAERIFTDKEALAEVENILFPYLLKDFDEFCKASSGPVIMESATVLEKPQFDGIGDAVILVDAPYELRLKRASLRDSSPVEKIAARMANQKLMNAFSDGSIHTYPEDSVWGKALKRVNLIIKNDGSTQKLEADVKDAIQVLEADHDMNINN